MGIWDPTGSGVRMGNATGAIRIDTTDLDRARSNVKRSSAEMDTSLGKVGTSAKKAGDGFKKFASDVRSIRGEIAGISAAAAILTGVGLNVAGNMEAAAIQFTGLTGGMESANKLMVDLRKKALAAGIPFNDMLKASKLLLPTLEGNINALDTYMQLSRRVSTLNPQEGITGAAFAINEALASGGTDLVSLSERFQVSRFKIREAMKETGGDFAASLDLVLNRMGITQKVADDMGRSFQASFARAKDSAGQLLGTGFAPLLDALTPLLNRATEFMVSLQETNPELLTMAAGVTAIVAAGGPLLLMLAQVVTSLQTIKTLSIAGSLGKAGAVGLSVAGGVGLGIEAARGIGRATGNEQLAQSGLGDVIRILKETVLAVSAQLQWWGANVFSFMQHLQQALGNLIGMLGSAMQVMASKISLLFPNRGAELANVAKALMAFGESIHLTNAQIDELNRANRQRVQDNIERQTRALFPELFDTGGDTGTNRADGGGGVVDEFTQEQIDAFADFQQDMKDLEEQGAEQRLRINEQYQEAVANIEERLADMRKRIADAERDAAESEAKAEEDYQIRRQQTIEDAQEDSIRAIEDFNRQRERDEREHRNNLFDAASRFDALGIIREMRSYNEKRSQADEDFRVSQTQRAEELQQRMAQEAEAHNREMGELRENNRRRLNELRQEYAEELRAAQEKLIRLRDAHNRELSDLSTKLQREREMRQRAFIEQFNSLAGSLNNQIQISRQGQAQIQGDLRNWWIRVRNEMNTILSSTNTGGSGAPGSDVGGAGGGGGAGKDSRVFPMAVGGPITDTSKLYQLHAGEEVLRPDVASQIRSIMGGSINQPALAAAMASGGRGGGMSIGSLTIPVYSAPGQSVQDIAVAVREELLNVFEKYNKS